MTKFKAITIILFLMLSSLVFADASDMSFKPGGTVVPVQNEFIILKNEQINITLYSGIFEVKVDYTFLNTGDSRKVVMGFPNSKYKTHQGVLYGINNFKAFDGKNELKTYRKDKEGKNDELYECFEVIFNKGDSKNITNTYSQSYMRSNSDDDIRAEYILTTGALWKNKIDSIKVEIVSKLPESELQKKTAYFVDYHTSDKGELIKNDFLFNIRPEKYKAAGNTFKMEFNNIKPDFNIEIRKPPLLIKSIKASSELKDNKKSDMYSVSNLIDGNPATVWAEGKKDSGINEYIEFDMIPYLANEAGAYKVTMIGFISGCAVNKDVFGKNNRVKTIRLDYKNYLYNSSSGNPFNMKETESLVFNLKDSMEMQYIEFREPLFISTMRITILDVYKGSKWDDSCISEVKIITSE